MTESSSNRWATKTVTFRSGNPNRSLKEEDLPSFLRMPLFANNVDAEPEVRTKEIVSIDGEDCPPNLTTTELKWVINLAEKHSITITRRNEEETYNPTRFTRFSADPCLKLSYLQNYRVDDVADEDMAWMIRFWEQTDIQPTTLVGSDDEEVDGEWVSIKDGFTINMVRTWDDLSATISEREADVKLSFMWSSRFLKVQFHTQQGAAWLDDPIVKLIVNRVRDAWRFTLKDIDDFEVDCEGLVGAERTQVCDPSYYRGDL